MVIVENKINIVREKVERIEKFLELLKINPEALERLVIINEYKELLETAFEEAKSNEDWAVFVIPELLKLNILDKSDEEKYKELLEIAFEEAKSNEDWAVFVIPELLELNILDKSEIKEKFNELLEAAFEEAKSNYNLAVFVIPELLELNILDKSEIKEKFNELLEAAFERAKSDQNWAVFVIPELLKLNILDKNEIKEKYIELLESALEEAKSNGDWAMHVVPELLKLNILDKSDEEKYKDLLKRAFEDAKLYSLWEKYVVPELLKLNILDKSEIKEKFNELLEAAFEEAKSNEDWAVYVIPELLKLNILDKSEIKENFNELLETAFVMAKSDNHWAVCVVPELLKLNILDKSDEEKYKELRETAFEEAKSHKEWARYVVPELLKLNILDKSEIKENYKELLETVFEEAKSDEDWAENVVPELLKLNILDKSEIKEKFNELLEAAFERAKSDQNWALFVMPELLKLNILDKSEIKENYKELLEAAFVMAKSDEDWAENVVPELLKLNILDKSEIKENFKELLEAAFVMAKSDEDWAVLVIPELLKLNILDKSEIKENFKFKEFLEIAFEEAKSNYNWAKYVVPELLKLNILDKSEIKEKFNELLETAFERAKSDEDWARYVVPELLKLNILDKSEIKDIESLKNITFISMRFLEKNKDVVCAEDIEYIDHIDKIFSREEIKILYGLDYNSFKEIENIVKDKNYQKIREFKKEFYPEGEKEKLGELSDYFGEGIWTYFVDKVPGNKLMKNRFRDPHNALLRCDDIIKLAKHLETRGVSKEEFINNYLGVAGDRNNGYQQLNDFLVKYKLNWKELVEGAMNMDEFKKNTDFMSLAEGVLEQEKTGGLYRNINNMEQILTLLYMIGNKEALAKLQKLADSEDPEDKVLYEYYSGAIYHPRTKPIIMEMYENPGEFLGLDDNTFSGLKEIHQAKKPSNMVENFEYLDFDAKDLVDCLPLGIYDQLSYFKPFEMKFYISGSEVYTKEKINEKIKDFLEGADQKKMSVIITKLKEQGDERMWFKEWKADKEEFVDKLLGEYPVEDLINMFVNLGYGEFNKYSGLKKMTAKISPKSDPNNWFNGFNCDSLAEGHGKKVVAMFNPYCTDFCIYEGDQDPNVDNLKVTSWVTLNRAIPKNFKSLLEYVKSKTTKDVFKALGDEFEDYKDPDEYVITMDNIEANPNFGSRNEIAIRKMYEKFFSEYVRLNPISPNGIPINTSKFYSGVNYNKLEILTDKVENKSLPVFVNAYTDNSGEYSLKGKLEAGEQKEKQKKVGIYPLSIEDVVQVSYMEGKIYPSTMKNHLGNLQHEITASILNNTLKNRENLSFAWYNEEGEIGGYILAYQGKMEDGTPGIYISDFAMEEKERGSAGLKMIHHWMDVVKESYPGMPIFTRAREDTSYRMIKAFAEKKGYVISKDNLIRDCGENWRRVVMEPKEVKTNVSYNVENLNEMKEKAFLREMTLDDIEEIEELERKIYTGTGVEKYIGKIGKDIRDMFGSLGGKPNLSFVWQNEEGKVGGYIFVERKKMRDGRPGIYISDFAMEEKERGSAGLKMMHHWMDVVKESYPRTPIFTRARENTSYRIIKAFAEKKGYEISDDYLERDGGENWHRVEMEPK